MFTKLKIFNFKKINLFVILFFTLLTIFISWPLVLNLDSAIFDFFIFDSLNIIWTINWNIHQIFKDPFNLFQANNFYPEKNALAYSENLLGISFLVLPIVKIFNNPVLAYNFSLFLSFILSGYGMFLLVYHLTKNYSASILASLTYTFAPFKILRMLIHLNIVSGQWLPFVFLYLEKFFEEKNLKNIILFSLFFILQSLTSLHYFVFLLVSVFVFFIIKIFLNRQILDKDFFKKIFISFFLIFIFLLPIFLPYFQIKEGSIGKAWEIAFYTPSLKDYLRVWYLLEKKELINNLEKFVFIGFVPLILLILSIFIFKKIKKENLIIYGVIGLIGFLLSLGPLIKIKEGYIFGFYLPFLFIPGFNQIRAVSRFSILLFFGLSIIFGLALAHLFKKEILKKFLFFFLSILFLFEIFFISLNLVKLIRIPVGKEIPEVYQWLKKEKEDFAILELPIAFKEQLPYLYALDINSFYQYFSIYHWKKLVNGDSSYYPNSYLERVKIFLNFPDEKSIKLIKELKIKYIILHYDLIPEKEMMENKIHQWPELSLKNVFGNDFLYEVK